ncbi:MAG: cobalamin biosynthesis protein CbiE, partial [Planctomycetota bacterium]
MKNRITIIGIGDDGAPGLTQHANALIQGASCLVGTSNLLAKFPDYSGPKEAIGADLDRLAQRLDQCGESVVVLA